MFLLGLFLMTFGIALSCKADLGTMPISSVPYVLSMFTGYTIGELTVILNMLFIIAQPVILRYIPWQQVLGQTATLLVFGPEIDFCMYLLRWFKPASLSEMWGACVLSAVILALGIFLCVKAKIFTAAGEGVVMVMDQVTGYGFAFLKNCFDISLVLVSLAISFTVFGEMRGVGLGTIAAAVLVGRMVRLSEKKLKYVTTWSVYLP